MTAAKHTNRWKDGEHCNYCHFPYGAGHSNIDKVRNSRNRRER